MECCYCNKHLEVGEGKFVGQTMPEQKKVKACDECYRAIKYCADDNCEDCPSSLSCKHSKLKFKCYLVDCHHCGLDTCLRWTADKF